VPGLHNIDKLYRVLYSVIQQLKSSCKLHKFEVFLLCPRSTYRGRVEIGECICPPSWSVLYNFVRDGKYSESGWPCIPHPHQLGLILPSCGMYARKWPLLLCVLCGCVTDEEKVSLFEREVHSVRSWMKIYNFCFMAEYEVKLEKFSLFAYVKVHICHLQPIVAKITAFESTHIILHLFWYCDKT
jgi:hypothetical protein